jgi:integrase
LTMASVERQSHQRRERQIQNRRSPEVNFGRFAADLCSTPIWWRRARFSSSTAARERRIEATTARNVLKRRSINKNYARKDKPHPFRDFEIFGRHNWIFASPVQLGRLPWSYPRVWQVFQEAAKAAKVGKLATHTMRHSYRSWLDAVGTPIAGQQKLMRHADIRTTLNVYGDVVTSQESEAHSKIVGLALKPA